MSPEQSEVLATRDKTAAAKARSSLDFESSFNCSATPVFLFSLLFFLLQLIICTTTIVRIYRQSRPVRLCERVTRKYP